MLMYFSMYKCTHCQVKKTIQSVFQIHFNKQQLSIYAEKKHYYVGKKVAHIDFVWHPNTLFKPKNISEDFSLLLKMLNYYFYYHFILLW